MPCLRQRLLSDNPCTLPAEDPTGDALVLRLSKLCSRHNNALFHLTNESLLPSSSRDCMVQVWKLLHYQPLHSTTSIHPVQTLANHDSAVTRLACCVLDQNRRPCIWGWCRRPCSISLWSQTAHTNWYTPAVWGQAGQIATPCCASQRPCRNLPYVDEPFVFTPMQAKHIRKHRKQVVKIVAPLQKHTHINLSFYSIAQDSTPTWG